ncbi:MAG TPA: hypothetical protein VN708_11105 [Terriglobales bacterium]|nr:hypothetical protein [Terriglobales bacterium]
MADQAVGIAKRAASAGDKSGVDGKTETLEHATEGIEPKNEPTTSGLRIPKPERDDETPKKSE